MTDHSEGNPRAFFSEFHIKPGVAASVVIPVKNEEFYIRNTLESFVNQVDLDGKPFDFELFEILILANNCTDRSVEFIQNFQETHPYLNLSVEEVTLSPKNANIGFVRKSLMDCANARLLAQNGGIILTTDGDTEVARDWLAQNIREIQNGADAVGGRILLHDNEMENLDESTFCFHTKDERYHLLISDLEAKIMCAHHDPAPRHHQHFNGSFAITADCYTRSGGVPIIKNLEDCAFFEKLQSMDAKIRHSFDVKVYTSARCIGRTEIGLSSQLNLWKNLEFSIESYMVESAASIYSRFILKKKLSDLWISKPESCVVLKEELLYIIPDIQFTQTQLRSLLKQPFFGSWYSKIMKISASQKQLSVSDCSPIDQAIEDLQLLTENYVLQDLVQTSIL